MNRATSCATRASHPASYPRLLLPPGAYTLVVCDEEWAELSRRSFEIAAGTTELDVAR